MAEDVKKRTRRRRSSEDQEATKESKGDDHGLRKEKETQKRRGAEEEVLIPYPHMKVVYIGPKEVGHAPTVNRYEYPKGRAVIVTKKEGERIIRRFGDVFKKI